MTNSFNTKLLLATVAGMALLLAAPDASAKTKAADKKAAVTTATAPTTTNAQEDAINLRLALNKIRLDADTGRLSEALDALDVLETKYPGNAQVLETKADLALRLDNRGMAFAAASQSSAPTAEARQREALLYPQGTFVDGGFDFRGTNGAFEQIWTTGGQMALTPQLALSADLRHDHIHTRSAVTRTNGVSDNFYGYRSQGSFSLDGMLSDGQEATATLYALENKVGLGARYSLWDRWGVTSLAADYNRPDTDNLESLIEHGTKHRVQVARTLSVIEDLHAKIDGAFNHYTLDDNANAAETLSWNFDVDYSRAIPLSAGRPGNEPGDNIVVGGRYAATAEYVSTIDRSLDNAGNSFKPLNLSSFEIHCFSVWASHEFLHGLNGEVSTGYSYNRIADTTGPLYAASLRYALDSNLSFDIHASRSLLSGSANGGKENLIGTNVRWNF